jgi:hypothetical protein
MLPTTATIIDIVLGGKPEKLYFSFRAWHTLQVNPLKPAEVQDFLKAYGAKYNGAVPDALAAQGFDATLPAEHFKSEEFCSMCGPRLCSMHLVRDLQRRAAGPAA